MDLHTRIQDVLDRVRPYLRVDGSDINLLDATATRARVQLTGRCANCPGAYLTLHYGVEAAIKEEIPELEELIVACPGGGSWLPRGSDASDASAVGLTRARSVTREACSSASIAVGPSVRMRAVLDFVRVIADSESTVLITGETGSGKELIANLIHDSSSRRHNPFLAVSCAILSETLIESELFGHERGAFTNAIKDRPSRFELADGGTLFLDDIDDVPLSIQVKLLRVLENRSVERVGGIRPIPVDVRILTGSKRDLRQLVADGKFRDDLFYRLNVIPIRLPPLRERPEDIPVLVEHFLKRHSQARGMTPKPVSPAVLQSFMRYPWPGNVRELENACERMVQMCLCDSVMAGCVPATVLFHKTGHPAPVATAGPFAVSLDDQLREVETNLISWALEMAGGNKSKAAELLKVKRSTLGDRIKKLGLADWKAANGRPSRTEHDSVPQGQAVPPGLGLDERGSA